jgi:multisubunit Na+/H+ antiporter MnhB subunit
MEFLVAQHGEEVRWIAVGGIAMALVSMAVIHLATERGDPRRDAALIFVRLIGALVVVIIGLVSATWATNAILLMLALTCAAQVAIDLVVSNPAPAEEEAV